MLKRAALVLLIAFSAGVTAEAATTTARFRPITSLKIKPSASASTVARIKLYNQRFLPSFGGIRRPLNRADPLNPQPLPPGPPPQNRALNRADPLNPQPLPPGPPPNKAIPKILPAATLRAR